MGYCGSKLSRKDKQNNKNNINDSQFQQYQIQNILSQSSNLNYSTQEQILQKKRDYKKSELIGKGSLFEVYQALDNKTGKIMAIKTVKIQGTKEQKYQLIDQLKAEIKLLKRLKHKNIIKYYFTEISSDFTQLDIALEYISQGSLKRVLSKIDLEESNIRIYSKQILEGIQYLHKKNIIHRNIKTSTILVDSEGTIKLSNFKNFIQFDQDFDINEKQKSFAIDILSLGAVIIEMFGGYILNFDELIKNISEVQKPPYPQQASALSKNLLDIIFVPDHQQYSTDKLLQHPFFNFEQEKKEFQLDDPNSDQSLIGSSFEVKKPFIQDINQDQSIQKCNILQNNKQRQQELEQALQSLLRQKNQQN
ncbi:unnamed protein product [Paramecium primaurelia]|uniref:Protein kinase domain-containing protein n=1 Tax=Paramecium primaurelia TaxID=5886 RepID=A0A8S1JM17_PARPR|nr:unnamed protein product [Paramecium primaurelia]